MEFYNSYLYALICKKASFDTLRKAEQVIALCNVEYYLEENCVGHAIARYEAWQKAFPEGIDSDHTPITIQEVCRIPDNDFCCMPWIYANVLQDLCADQYEPEEGEITAQSELNYMGARSYATWIWQDDSSYDSFNYAYTKFMNTEWVQDFLKNMEIPWPLTPAWDAKHPEVEGETIWPSEAHIVITPKFKPGPLPPSPILAAYDGEVPFLEEAFLEPVLEPVIEVPQVPQQKPEGPPKVRDEGFWPFMRCKNVYKAYGGTGRLSHHDLLVWLGNKFKIPVEQLKKTDPYTLNAKGLPRGYYWAK